MNNNTLLDGKYGIINVDIVARKLHLDRICNNRLQGWRNMEKTKAYKYTINVKETAKLIDVLLLMSEEREKGTLKVKSVQGKNRIILYSVHPDMTFDSIGEILGEVEEYTVYSATEYDVFNNDINKELYNDESDKIVSIFIE